MSLISCDFSARGLSFVLVLFLALVAPSAAFACADGCSGACGGTGVELATSEITLFSVSCARDLAARVVAKSGEVARAKRAAPGGETRGVELRASVVLFNLSDDTTAQVALRSEGWAHLRECLAAGFAKEGIDYRDGTSSDVRVSASDLALSCRVVDCAVRKTLTLSPNLDGTGEVHVRQCSEIAVARVMLVDRRDDSIPYIEEAHPRFDAHVTFKHDATANAIVPLSIVESFYYLLPENRSWVPPGL